MRLTIGHPTKSSLWTRQLVRLDNPGLVRFAKFVWRDLLPTAMMLLLLGGLTLLALDFLKS